MTRIFLALAAVLVVSAPLSAAEWVALSGAPADAEAAARVTASDLAATVIEVDVPGMFVEAAGGERAATDVSIPGARKLAHPGLPELPFLSYLVAIPDQGNVELEVECSGERALEGFDIAASPPLEQEGVPGNPDPAVYDRNALWPPEAASLGEPAVMRDVRLVQVRVFPVRWNPVTRTLVASERVTVRVNAVGGQGVNEKTAVRPFRSEAFEPLYRTMLANYDALPRVELRRGTYLILANNNFATSIADLATWKQQRGVETVVVPLSTIGASPTNTDIKAYIQTAYDTWDNPPDYVMLLGDAMSGTFGTFPTWYYAYGGYSNCTDHPYSELEGGDYLPDVVVGRMAVDTASETIVAALKVLSYERDCDAPNDDWYERALMVAANCCASPVNPTSPRRTKLRIAEMLYDHGYAQVDTVFYPPVTGYTEITNSINSGVGFVNYRGWANAAGWEYPNFKVENIQTLANGRMLPVMTSIVCGTGNFDSPVDPCFGEKWLRVGTPAALKGGPAFFGPSYIHTNTRYNNAIDTGIYEGILHEDIDHFGLATVRGKLEVYRSFPDETAPGDNVETYFNIYNVLGDPELFLRTARPGSFTVDHPVALPQGQNMLTVTATDSGGQPVEDAEVVVILNGELDQVRSMDGATSVVIPLPGGFTGYIGVTVWARNMKPYRGTVPIGQLSPYVGYLSHVVDDDASGASSGNGDGIPNPGERIELAVTVKDFGVDPVTGVSVGIDPDGLPITGVDLQAFYGNISAGGTAVGDAPFVFDIDQNLPDGSELVLPLVASSGASTWESVVPLEVAAPALSFLSVSVSDGGNGALDPGETAQLTVTLSNGGSGDAVGVTGTLLGPGSGLIVTDDAGSWGDINSGAMVSNGANRFTVQAAASVAIGHEFTLVIDLVGTDGMYQFVTFPLVVGTVTTDDALGPDAYGYFCYDNTDAASSEKPTYSWVEIDPAYGGTGTNLNLGFEDVTNVALPFAFQYYGEAFTQLGIGSNGTIGVGGCPVWERQPRNGPIPAPLGPDAMVAPFWDELDPSATGAGDVFTKNLGDGRFVVEWSRVATVYPNEGNTQTFQAIFYDPAVYSTLTGDGEIAFQYHTIANADTGSNANTGEYCTVGIENLDQTDGLLYTFCNAYPPAAAPLANGRAIKFTTDPPDAYPSSGVPEGVPAIGVVIVGVTPNPFNPVTEIVYGIPEAAPVELSIYDLAGRRVATLVDGAVEAGFHSARWDGTTDGGGQAASGVYFCRVSALGEERSAKMVLLK